MIKPPFKCQDWKRYNHSWIIQKFPSNYKDLIYIEVCLGGGSVFLNKKPSKEEIINDIDPNIIAIWKSLRDRPDTFTSDISKVKYDEESFNAIKTRPKNSILEVAVDDYLLRKMTRNEEKQDFVKKQKIETSHLPPITERLQNTVILRQNILEIVKLWDNENVLFYIDPPVLPTIRLQEENHIGIDMTTEEHVDFMHRIKETKAKCVITGLTSNLYQKHLKTWKCYKQETKNKKTECLWCNYA